MEKENEVLKQQIKILEEENKQLKEHLKKYTAPSRSKTYYDNDFIFLHKIDLKTGRFRFAKV